MAEGKWVRIDGGDYQFIEWKEALTRKFVQNARDKAAAKKRRQRSMSPGDTEGDIQGDRLVVLTNNQQPTTNYQQTNRFSSRCVVEKSGTSPARACEGDEFAPGEWEHLNTKADRLMWEMYDQ